MTKASNPPHEVMGTHVEYAIMSVAQGCTQVQTIVADYGMDRASAEQAQLELMALGDRHARLVSRAVTVSYGPWKTAVSAFPREATP